MYPWHQCNSAILHTFIQKKQWLFYQTVQNMPLCKISIVQYMKWIVNNMKWWTQKDASFLCCFDNQTIRPTDHLTNITKEMAIQILWQFYNNFMAILDLWAIQMKNVLSAVQNMPIVQNQIPKMFATPEDES